MCAKNIHSFVLLLIVLLLIYKAPSHSHSQKPPAIAQVETILMSASSS